MSTGAASTVTVPDIGDFSDVPVIEILVSEGDTVAEEDPLVTLESDKATMDVPAPFAGVVKSVTVSVGDKVSEGSPLMEIAGQDSPPAEQPAAEDPASGEGSSPAPAAPAQPPEAEAERAQPEAGQAEGERAQPDAEQGQAEQAQAATAPPSEGNGGGPIYASPAARRLARELGVELSRLRGSGRKGRITKEDVQRAADGGAPEAAPQAAPGAALATGVGGLELLPWPKVEFEKFGPVERVERSRIQRISAPNLARNWVMIPHVTHDDEADVTELEAWRKQLNSEQSDVKVTMVSFLIAASVATLKRFETFNASLDGEQLVLKRYYNIGFAADTPGGLVVPVIKDADKKGLLEIAGELGELSSKARAGKLSPGEMTGATFTISSLGGIGGTGFTPIINAPEVAILGATRSAMKPVWNGSEFEPRLMVPLSLSYDHRVIDGALAARFMVQLVQTLSDLRRALL